MISIIASISFVLVPRMFAESLYLKSVQIRSFLWSVFSRILTEYGPQKTPYLDTFHAMKLMQNGSKIESPTSLPLKSHAE